MRSRTSCALVQRGERPHPGRLVARQAERGLVQPFAQRLDQRIDMIARRDDATDGGAFLARLDGHFARDFLDEEVEFRRAGHGVRPQDGGVQAVRLHGEAHRIGDDRR